MATVVLSNTCRHQRSAETQLKDQAEILEALPTKVPDADLQQPRPKRKATGQLKAKTQKSTEAGGAAVGSRP